MQTRVGKTIEDSSMAVIESEVGAHPYDSREWPVVRRVIHSTADFDFADKNRVLFEADPIQKGIEALCGGCTIVTDVNGIPGLLNKASLSRLGVHTVCRISDDDIAQIAKERDTTRARASMRACASDMNGGILAVGNAPTALLEVISMIQEGAACPAVIVGVPVGFIQAAESKERLRQLSGVSYITNMGRKGGSSVAAAIVNALLIQAVSSSSP